MDGALIKQDPLLQCQLPALAAGLGTSCTNRSGGQPGQGWGWYGAQSGSSGCLRIPSSRNGQTPPCPPVPRASQYLQVEELGVGLPEGWGSLSLGAQGCPSHSGRAAPLSSINR